MTETKLSRAQRTQTAALFLSGLVLGCALCIASWAQTPAPPTSSTVQPNGWHKLSPQAKRALAPLAARWGELSEIQKGKWLAISENFDQLPPADKAIMHTRMSEWVNLSTVQRNQARLNFSASQNLPKDEKKAKWDEYQSLSPEQRQQLSDANQGPAKTTASSSKPTNAQRFVVPPPSRQASQTPSQMPSRAPIDKKTLLPLPADNASKASSPSQDSTNPKDETPSS